MHNTCCALKHGRIPKRYVLVILQRGCAALLKIFVFAEQRIFIFV